MHRIRFAFLLLTGFVAAAFALGFTVDADALKAFLGLSTAEEPIAVLPVGFKKQ